MTYEINETNTATEEEAQEFMSWMAGEIITSGEEGN